MAQCPYVTDHPVHEVCPVQCVRNEHPADAKHHYSLHGEPCYTGKFGWRLPESFTGSRLTPVIIEADRVRSMEIYRFQHVHNTLGTCIKSRFTPEGSCPVVLKTETEKEDPTVSVTIEPKYRAVVHTLDSYKKRLSHESAEYDKIEDASGFISMIATRGVPVIEARIETSDVVTTISRGEWKPF